MKNESKFFLKKIKNSVVLYISIFIIGLSTNATFAQSKVVKGTVKDDTGEVVPGASVFEKGTSNGTSTDFDGNYSLKVSESATLTFSYVGYAAKEVLVGNQTNINVTLISNNSLDEVVVIGYGSVRKSDLTGAISSVGAKDFEKQPLFRAEDALQGRAAGVQISKNSGAPGAELKIRIRGNNSITRGNQPLVVVDGVFGADLRAVDSNDIESIQILKDASATAIYGVQGSNGVILVTTKKGRGKAKISVSSYTSFSEVPRFVDKLSPEEFAQINGETLIGSGTDYQKEYFKTGITSNTQLSLRGKSDNVGYFISTSILDQEGIDINSGYERYNLRSNTNVDVNENLKIGLNINGTVENYFNLLSNGSRTSTDNRAGINALIGWDPLTPVTDENGSYNLTSTNNLASQFVNPIAVRRESERKNTKTTINTNLNINYKLNEDLTLNLSGSYLHRGSFTRNYIGVQPGLDPLRPSNSGAGYSSRTSIQGTSTLNWVKEFGKHRIEALAGFEIISRYTKRFSGSVGDIDDPFDTKEFYLVDQFPLNEKGYSNDLDKRFIRSLFARVQYVFNDNLLITATVRRDQAGVFVGKNQVGIFPSGAIAYKLDEILPEDSFINSLKLRMSYGETGNQGASFGDTTPKFEERTINFPLDGINADNGGLVLGSPANGNLVWETTRQAGLGFDMSMFDNRVNLTADVYYKRTSDLFLDVDLPTFLGLDHANNLGGNINIKKFIDNVGQVSNKGLEISINGNIIENDKLTWSSSVNFSMNRNNVDKLDGVQTEIFVNPAGRSGSTNGAMAIVKVGEPLGLFHGVTFLGTIKSAESGLGKPAGGVKYITDDTNSSITGIIGNPNPDYTLGFSNTLTYGNLDFSFLINTTQGFDVLNLTRGVNSLNVDNPTWGDYRDRWTPENETDIPVTGTNFINSTRYVEDGSFIRLSNVSLGYNLKNMINGFNLVRVYASGQNLFTITDYTGYDPEVSSTTVNSSTGASIDWGAYPNPRTITIGINLEF
ncbi:TonB-linked SusC/RagA family outer membrane protein [Lutibacter sp. Hel_I_33_5]|uniref:SusC/RagA family TonB-linked outer membrane protein n=1 Tax=Lutibacter sp. Hel_I_33_5 TaxID=1566289 RepID=UPI0011A6E1E3|nr:TonB-dependent receptor [Lutibacter sp. Hel_I_33_5]TVZ55645.1 TonB-linked SusC/RagA family outer membrane protein [Lutibacter sp. Hel_I_33_5]